jgi:acetyltransferase-like isoleucine patch superfamily enzyme
MASDHWLNRARNLLYFGVRYPWVKHGRNVHVQWSTTMWSAHRHVIIGNDVGLGKNCTIQCDLEIGNKVLIAGAVAFVGSDDHVYNRIGTPMWDSGRGDARTTIVEDDVWIGWGSIILSGARIGRGSIIAAGSVVVGEVAPYSIMIPQKAKLLRSRFSPEESAAHDETLSAQGLFGSR